MRHRALEILSIDAGLMKRWRCIIYAAIGNDEHVGQPPSPVGFALPHGSLVGQAKAYPAKS